MERLAGKPTHSTRWSPLSSLRAGGGLSFSAPCLSASLAHRRYAGSVGWGCGGKGPSLNASTLEQRGDRKTEFITTFYFGNSLVAGEGLKKRQEIEDQGFGSQAHHHVFFSSLFLPNLCLAHPFQILLLKMPENSPRGEHVPSADRDGGKKEEGPETTGVIGLPFKTMVGCDPG